MGHVSFIDSIWYKRTMPNSIINSDGLSHALLEWYSREKKTLPWRDDPRVYWVWVGEIMSQQTTLAVAVPRFNDFIVSLPDVRELAYCPEPVLRELWSGLGYYARARNIQKGARYIMDRHGGGWPMNYEQWIQVPGCGPYTSAILASVCFGERIAAVDGNAIRVASRLLDMRAGVWSAEGQERLRSFLQSQIDGVISPGDFNQAVMELGQEVCRKSRPRCEACPIVEMCLAHRRDTTSHCPPPKPRKPPVQLGLDVVALLRRGGELVGLGRRRKGFLSRTIGFPLVGRESETAGLLQEICLGMELPATHHIPTFWHTITRYKLECRVLEVTVDDSRWDSRLESELLRALSVEAIHWVEMSRAGSELSSSLDRKAWRIFTGSTYNSRNKEGLEWAKSK